MPNSGPNGAVSPIDGLNTAPQKGADWRIWLGLGITVIWLLLGWQYIANNVGWEKFSSLPVDTMGNFLEGAFAPLAFLWLVIGYFLQHKELEQNTRTLAAQARQISRTAEQAEIQTERMADSEKHARQETFLQIVNNVYRQLASIAGLLYISSQGSNAAGTVSSEEISQLFSQSASQDHEVFSRRLLETHLQAEEKDQYDLFYGTEIRARHSNHFIFAYERMLRRANEVDTDHMIRDALLASAHGFIYGIAKQHQGNAPEHLNHHDKTGVFIELIARPDDPSANVSQYPTT